MQELRFFRPLAGRTDSGRSPERGGGRKVGARRSTTCSDASTSEPCPLPGPLYGRDPHPYPSPQGGGEWLAHDGGGGASKHAPPGLCYIGGVRPSRLGVGPRPRVEGG